jgi:hypothetical protein
MKLQCSHISACLTDIAASFKWERRIRKDYVNSPFNERIRDRVSPPGLTSNITGCGLYRIMERNQVKHRCEKNLVRISRSEPLIACM